MEALFALLRACLKGTAPDADLFSGEVPWERLYTLSDEQAVSPLVTDGIEMLPDARKPGIELLEPFLADTMATEIRNDTMDRFAGGLFKALYKAGIPALMVKGQGLAPLYPDPRHRQPGDIDILVRPADYERTKALLLPKATQVDAEHPEILHQGMMFGSVEVEIHGSISTLMSVALDRKLSALLDDLFRKEDFTEVTVGGTPVKTPSALFNAVYILVHFLHHYWSSGVGLRQLIDWELFVTKNFDRIDRAELEALLQDLGLMRLWQTFGGLAADRLGADPARIPFYSDRYRNKYDGIVRYILRSGNFGHNQTRAPKPRQYFLRKVHSFWRLVVCDRLRHFPEFPAESLRYFFGATHYGLIRLSEGE